jgi:hypothetical protein
MATLISCDLRSKGIPLSKLWRLEREGRFPKRVDRRLLTLFRFGTAQAVFAGSARRFPPARLLVPPDAAGLVVL